MNPGWQSRHIQTAAQYQADVNLLKSQGFRPLDVNGYSINGVDHFTSVWEQSPGPAWILRHDQTSDQHDALVDTFLNDGFRPVSISGYDKGGEARFASLWYQSGGTALEVRHGLTAAQYQTAFNELKDRGFRPVDLCGYTVGGQVRFAVIWDQSPMPEWVARHDMSPGDYHAAYRHWEDHGFVLWRVSGYDDGGQTRYAAIWVKGPALTWTAREGLSSSGYQAAFNALRTRGFRVAKVNGYTVAGQTHFAGIWHKPYLSDDDENFIRQTVATFMTNHGMPGGSVALTHQGRLVFAQGYGVANPATSTPVTTDHLFRMASVAKPITAVAVFRLIEAGLLNLNDRIFGANAILGTTYGTQPYAANIDQITVQHLLEHTSGWAESQDPMFGQLNLTQEQLIDFMIDHVSLTHIPPGTRHSYLNFGYCVLGRVIEEVTGLTYENAVLQHVLEPCGVTDMHIAGDTLADRRPNEVVYVQQGTWNPYGIRVSRMDAHGGWIASATDLLRFLVRVDGFSTKPDILSPGSLTTMATPTTALMPLGGQYAKGWATNTAGNRWHLGDFGGTVSEILRTNNEFGWAALFNSRNDAQLDQMRMDMDGLFWTIVGRITDWPKIDRF